MFCKNCGKQIEDNSKFCMHCGESLLITNNKKIIEGKIHKCPNCGEIINGFVLNCPSCNYEIRDRDNNSIKDFSKKIYELELRRKEKKKGVMGKLMNGFGYGALDEVDKQIISLIKTYSVPNTKEDYLEFITMACSNIDESVYGVLTRNPDMAANERQKAINAAWKSKVKQVYQKACLSYGNDPDFESIRILYKEKIGDMKKAKRNQSLTIIIILAFVFLGIAGLLAFSLYILKHAPDEEELSSFINYVSYNEWR